jgi:plastocyanin
MKKAIVAILFILFLIPFCLADLVITLEKTNITTTVGVEYNLNINFTNTNNFDIYNLSMEYDTEATFEPISKISVNQTNSSVLKIKTTRYYDDYKNFTFFYYFYENITYNTTTENVNLTNTAFVPNEIRIVQGSTIIFTNKDDLPHKIVDLGGEFESPDLQPESSFQYTFNQVKNYTLEEYYLKYQMKIIVEPQIRPTLVRNKDYDKNFTIFISSRYSPTTLNVSLLTENITVAWNGSEEIVMSISNTGNETAKGIKFNAMWMQFSKNDFDLNPNSLTYVIINVKPEINDSAETNKTHIKNITITSLNTEPITLSLYIFIPYESQDNINKYKSVIPEEGNPFLCPSNLYELRNGILYCVNSTVKYVYLNATSPEYWLNITEEQKQELFSTLGYLKAGFNDLRDKYKIQEGRMDNLTNLINDVKKMTEENRKDIEKDRSQATAFVVFIVVLFVIGIVSFLAYKIFESKKMRELEEY